ncbi:MAG TPA: Dabb family protein [Caproiciproducens sp.]|nr:Dabb family protein [Caproiciproducens sp.]
MVKHLVLWSLTEGAKKDGDKIIADLNRRFKALLGVVDGLTAIEVGKNYNGGKFDLVLYCEFTSKEAQEKYQTHPAHIAIKNDVHTLVSGRECVDYEI